MRLLVIMPTREHGGAEEYALKVVTAAALQWDVHVAIPETKGTESLIVDLKARSSTFHLFDIPEEHFLAMKEELLWKNVVFPKTGVIPRAFGIASKGLFRFRETGQAAVQFIRALSLLLRVRPDVVLVNVCWATFGMGIILACGFMKIPTAVVFHSYPFPFSFRDSKVKAYNWARKRNQQWITVSESSRRLICGTFQLRPDEVRVIYNGVSQLKAPGEPASPEDDLETHSHFRRELGVPETAQLLLTVARLDLNKGYGDLIQTVPHIVKEFPDVRFVWVGGGDNRDLLVQKLNEYCVSDHVLLLGHRLDVSRLMASSDLFVLPTRFEGLPFTILEAMARGLPIVSTNVGGIPEVIHDRVHGLLNRAGDSCDLLESIRWALRHPDQMQEMARNAKLRVAEFSDHKMVEQTLQVLQKLGSMCNRES
jgi:glycosyltransferase involved in cell wall biosynthesis